MPANLLLIVACVGASLWAWQQPPAFVQHNLIFSYTNLIHGRFWTLATALFVHASAVHLLGNMIFLFVFGSTLEHEAGARKYLTIFFTGGLAAFVLSLPFMPRGAGLLGASAAIFTLAACVLLVRPFKFSWLFLAPQGLVALAYFIYNVIVVSYPKWVHGYDPHVAYVAHIIGFLAGLPFGVALSSRWKTNLVFTLVIFGVYLAILNEAARFLRALAD